MNTRKSHASVSCIRRPAYIPAIVTAWFGECGIPCPVYEYPHIPGRDFRLDIAWPEMRVGIEVQGGIHPFPRKRKDGTVILMPGAHGTTAGIRRDNEKSNLSLVNGWAVLKVEPRDLCTQETAEMVRALLHT